MTKKGHLNILEVNRYSEIWIDGLFRNLPVFKTDWRRWYEQIFMGISMAGCACLWTTQ